MFEDFNNVENREYLGYIILDDKEKIYFPEDISTINS